MVSVMLSATFTVTLHFALTPLPSAAVAVISAVPFATAVTVPSALTVATLVLELLHVTLLLAALLGDTDAVSRLVWPLDVSAKLDGRNRILLDFHWCLESPSVSGSRLEPV